jgi:hypothetical protein
VEKRPNIFLKQEKVVVKNHLTLVKEKEKRYIGE